LVFRAIESGANALAEGFLFAVAAGIIIGETWRSSRNQSKRRDDVDDRLEDLDSRVAELTTRFNGLASQIEDRLDEERRRCVDYLCSKLPVFSYCFLGTTNYLEYWNEWWKLGYVADGQSLRRHHFEYHE
jgi:hypothetical protein